MNVILTESIESLGIIGSEVKVATGFARNYLLPQKKAVLATPANRKRLEQEKKKFDLQIAKEKAFAEEMAKRIEGVVCVIQAKVSDEEKLYGSVSIREIMDSLAKQGVEVTKDMIMLAEPIKTTGRFEVPIRVYKGVKPVIIVEVVPEEKV
jgi:large subunit ribosomal protein L9